MPNSILVFSSRCFAHEKASELRSPVQAVVVASSHSPCLRHTFVRIIRTMLQPLSVVLPPFAPGSLREWRAEQNSTDPLETAGYLEDRCFRNQCRRRSIQELGHQHPLCT